MPTREENLDRLRRETFDVLIIGGGASGLGSALDATLRGLKVALVEADDYGAGASTASTKLVHGGVRYLEKAVKELDWGQYKLVREALHERQHMLTAAPHLAWPARFLIPAFSAWEKFYFGLGCRMYDWTAGRGSTLAGTEVIGKKEALARLPEMTDKRLSGAVVYSDGQFDDSAFSLAMMRTAESLGAVLVNHLPVQGLLRGNYGRLRGAFVRSELNREGFEVTAKVILNCTGAQSDRIRLMARPEAPTRLRPSKGIHLVLDKHWLLGRDGMLIPRTADGRVIFVLPWRHGTLIGTTDTETLDPFAEPEITREDVHYLIEQTAPYLGKSLSISDVRSAFAGNRPLVASGKRKGKQTEALIRNHEVEVFHEEGLINLLGGKWTTYRQMAEEAIDAVEVQLGKQPTRPVQTSGYLLEGVPKVPLPSIVAFAGYYQLPLDVASHLYVYGDHARTLAETIGRDGLTLLHPDFPFTTAEVAFWVKQGQACTIRDMLRRRLPLEVANLEAAISAAPIVASIMAKLLNWPEMETAWNLDQYQRELEERQTAWKS
jgi:glycerol-3-phosphate dehydrogenase